MIIIIITKNIIIKIIKENEHNNNKVARVRSSTSPQIMKTREEILNYLKIALYI